MKPTGLIVDRTTITLGFWWRDDSTSYLQRTLNPCNESLTSWGDFLRQLARRLKDGRYELHHHKRGSLQVRVVDHDITLVKFQGSPWIETCADVANIAWCVLPRGQYRFCLRKLKETTDACRFD